MIGIDVCSISRFHNMNNLDSFLKKYFTTREIEYIGEGKSKYEHIASIFSLKEAFVKALGTGFGQINPIDVEIIHNFSKKPNIILHNHNIASLNNIECSVTHDGGVAIAVVVIEALIKDYCKNLDEYKILLKNRDIYGHKGTFGKVGIVGGSVGMCGSVYLSAKSALRSGSGLVYNICPKSISEILQIKSVENIILPVDDFSNGHFVSKSIDEILDKIKNLDALAIGPGMSKNSDNIIILKEIIKNFSNPIVIDADALVSFKYLLKEFSNRNNIVLTPHASEFSNLSGYNIDYINNNRNESSKRFLNENQLNLILVLKGKGTIVRNKNNFYINNTGNDGMATAGSGDCLTGIILSLLGQKIDAFNCAKLGVFIHGLAADIASTYVGKDSLIASDIIKYLPCAIKQIRR